MLCWKPSWISSCLSYELGVHGEKESMKLGYY